MSEEKVSSWVTCNECGMALQTGELCPVCSAVTATKVTLQQFAQMLMQGGLQGFANEIQKSVQAATLSDWGRLLGSWLEKNA